MRTSSCLSSCVYAHVCLYSPCCRTVLALSSRPPLPLQSHRCATAQLTMQGTQCELFVQVPFLQHTRVWLFKQLLGHVHRWTRPSPYASFSQYSNATNAVNRVLFSLHVSYWEERLLLIILYCMWCDVYVSKFVAISLFTCCMSQAGIPSTFYLELVCL